MRLIDADAMKDTNDNVIAVIDPETKSKYWISLNDYINAQPTVPQFGQWINVKDDTPQIAGCEVLLVVENKFEQRRIITAFQGYGDFKWHTSNVDYMAYRPDDFLSDKWKPLYWMPLPEPPKAKKDGDSREKKYYWIGNEYDGYADGNPVYYLWECSRCGYEHYGEQDTLTNYCPNCGAKMQMQPPEEENKNEID